jgi:TetR/AcrR family transcriptional repressor of nem operon
MPRSKATKAATREHSAAAAGRVFRRDGYAAAAVDTVMAEAGLTRGGFYAHFASKEALFAEVMATDHGLIRMLARRDPHGDWRAQTGRIVGDYLQPAHLAEVAAGCSFAALTGDVARAGSAVREAYTSAWRRACAELLRRPGEDWRQAIARSDETGRGAASALLAMAVGSLGVAQALAGEAARAALLDNVRCAVLDRLNDLLRDAPRTAPAHRRPVRAGVRARAGRPGRASARPR